MPPIRLGEPKKKTNNLKVIGERTTKKGVVTSASGTFAERSPVGTVIEKDKKKKKSEPIRLGSSSKKSSSNKSEPIKLGKSAEPVKTESLDNLKKVGFKDWVKQNTKEHPIMVGSTIALAITAAATSAMAIAGVSFVGGTTAGTTGNTAVITQTKYAHDLVKTTTGGARLVGRGAITTQRAFTGASATKNAGLVNKMFALGYKTNAATQAATVGLIGKATGMGVGGALIMAATIGGTYPFAKFELAESMDKIGIAMFSAMQAEDWDTVAELAQIQQEMSDPSMTDKILHLIPFVNVYDAAAKNAAAAVKSAEIFAYLAEQKQIASENGESETDMWARIEKDKDEKKEADRIADEEYYAQVAEDAADAKAAARADDEAYWAGILEDREAQAEANRIAEDKYWAEVRITNDKANAESAPSALNFGLL